MTEPATVSVRGTAVLEVPPDEALVHLEASRLDPDRERAVVGVREAVQAVRAALATATGVRGFGFNRQSVAEQGHWDEDSKTHVTEWFASVGGTATVDPDAVGSVTGLVVAAGAQVSGVEWLARPDNPGFREVRRQAVADAARAAADFAAALDGTLGALVALADPGLLDAGQGALSPARPLSHRHLSAGAGPDSYEIDLDPRAVELRATVEARYVLAP
jgi:uncharacterized protein YggE